MTTTLAPHTTLEVATQCAASLARVAIGAFNIHATRFGEVAIQGYSHEMPVDLPETLGLAHTRTYTHGGHTYATYEGKGLGVYSTIDVRLVFVSQALPADCEAGSE
ncbi:MAG: hypothetical protein ACXVXP_12975 [Mycobacteriaceae bacterium]